ncbi:MAG: hypothetical protein RL358_211 [Pseudomonadota bacterium]|jgi:methyl-accepting chemotaxis protein
MKKLTLQQQLRAMTAVSLFGMCVVIIFVLISLNQLRQEFHTYQTMQSMDSGLIDIKATALSVSRADPIMAETTPQLAQADAHIQALQQRIVTLSDNDALKSTLLALSKQWAAYAQGFKGAIEIATTSPADALQIPDAMYSMYLAPMVLELDRLVDANKIIEQVSEQKIDTLMRNILWVVLLPMVLLGMVITVSQSVFGQSLRKRLENIVSEIIHLHNGDLSRRLATHHNDEIGQLSQTINHFIARFESILQEVQTSADQTHKTAHGVSEMAHSVTVNAKHQSTKVAQVSNAIEGMGNTIKKIAVNAGDASGAANQTLTLVRTGSATGQSTILALGQIDLAVGSSVKTLSELGAAIQRISSVSKLIKGIAEQTNLLALNAAIEAARAGEQGRGFAVVADEVRKLAERTTDATADIAKIVQSIENETLEASTAMSLAKHEVAQGVVHGNSMGDLLRRIENSVLVVTEMMSQIAHATEDQSAAGEHIWRNIDSVATISAKTASDIEHARNEMLTLTHSSQALSETVGQFKLSRAM